MYSSGDGECRLNYEPPSSVTRFRRILLTTLENVAWSSTMYPKSIEAKEKLKIFIFVVIPVSTDSW